MLRRPLIDKKDSKFGISAYQTSEKLHRSAERIQAMQLVDLLSSPIREGISGILNVGQITLDYSKNLYDEKLVTELMELAAEADLKSEIDQLFQWENTRSYVEQGPLHTALRAPHYSTNTAIAEKVDNGLEKMHRFCAQARSGGLKGYSNKPISQFVVLGIGGSYLGPKFCSEALKDYHLDGIKVDYVSSLDPLEILDVLDGASPENTLFIISSKSFSTLETLENAKAAKDFLLKNGCTERELQKHFVAITSKSDKAIEFGVSENYIFPIWDWVGGRYSLWSAIGLPVMLQIGAEAFGLLLSGAREMDEHFKTAPFAENMPVLMALFGIWYRNFWDARSHGIVTYSYRLRSFTEHLQQVDMESNGKSVTKNGHSVDYATGPIIWGGMGNNGQHAYYQLLHQGVELVPVDFILLLKSPRHIGEHHQLLYSSGVGQAQALMEGRSLEQLRADDSLNEESLSHHVVPGQQPSNTLLLESLCPQSLGALLALYEHKVFCQGIIWQIDSFDQCGVELGKALASRVHASLNAMGSGSDSLDKSTQYLLSRYHKSPD